MTHFIKRGSEFDVTDSANMDVRDHLPAKTFIVRSAPMRGYYLEQMEDMTIPARLYGDTAHHVGRIIQSFNSRPANTGVLLSGEKGSGKSMTMRALSLAVAGLDMPTIVINDEHCGDAFNKFMQSITQPCLIAFDEFEKTYGEDAQNQVLTLLDGMFTSRKLFVFTVNNTYKVNKHFLNRPGRMFYNIRFKGVPIEAVRQYCAENLLECATKIQDVERVVRTVDAFNFDMLKALVEEMNRFDETATEAVQLMNILPEAVADVTYKLEVTKDGKTLRFYSYGGQNPIAQVRTQINIDMPHGDPRPDYELVVQPSDLKHMDEITGALHFEKDGHELVFTKVYFQQYAF